MAYSEDRVFNIEYYSLLKYYGIASESIYTCDYEPNQAISHLSFVRTKKAFLSEMAKMKKEKAFLSARNVQRSDELLSDSIASAMMTFCMIRGEENNYASFLNRVKIIRNVIGTMRTSTSWKRRFVQLCYNNGFMYPIYVYYCHKQKRSMS